jgi:hypothetical protein
MNNLNKDFLKLMEELKVAILYNLVKSHPKRLGSDYVKILISQGFINVESKYVNKILYDYKHVFNPNLDKNNKPAWTIIDENENKNKDANPTKYNKIDEILLKTISLNKLNELIVNKWISNNFKGSVNVYFKKASRSLILYLALQSLRKLSVVYFYFERKATSIAFEKLLTQFIKDNELDISLMKFHEARKPGSKLVCILNNLSEISKIKDKDYSAIISFTSSKNNYDLSKFRSYLHIQQLSFTSDISDADDDLIFEYQFVDYLNDENKYLFNCLFFDYSKIEKKDYLATCTGLIQMGCITNSSDWFDFWLEIENEEKKKIKTNRTLTFYKNQYTKIINNQMKFDFLIDYLSKNKDANHILIYNESAVQILLLIDELVSLGLYYELHTKKEDLQPYCSDSSRNPIVTIIDDSVIESNLSIQPTEIVFAFGMMGNSKKLLALIAFLDSTPYEKQLNVNLLLTNNTFDDFRIYPQAYSLLRDQLISNYDKQNNTSSTEKNVAKNDHSTKYNDELLIIGSVSNLSNKFNQLLRKSLDSNIKDIIYLKVDKLNYLQIINEIINLNSMYIYFQHDFTDTEIKLLGPKLINELNQRYIRLEKSKTFSIAPILSFVVEISDLYKETHEVSNKS